MIYEFIGLPGSGKSTIFTAAAEKMNAIGLEQTTMRMLAKRVVEEDRLKIGFLRRREQRISMYGAMAFAESEPEIFDLLFRNARSDLSTTLWNMEMMSHLHFAARRDLSDLLIFMDEGYLHRGAASFLLSRDEAGYLDYINRLPSSHTIIHVNAPLDLAFARSQGRKMKKRVPEAWRGTSDLELRDNLGYFGHLVRLGCDRLKQRGTRVIEIDASAPVEMSSELLLEAVLAAPHIPT